MSTPSAWSLSVDQERIGWLTVDKPGSSANTLGRAGLNELRQQLDSAAAHSLKGLVIRSSKPSGFMAGADIREFSNAESQASMREVIALGQGLFERIEALPCPVVAALHGFALGGGLELAMACHYRVAVGDSKLSLGLPEVQLGLHPGFGGTVRSVRLLGVRPAMQLMLTGRPVRADQALKLGLVDRLVGSTAELESAARELIGAAPPRHRPPLAERCLSLPGIRALLRPALLRQLAARARRDHYPAPYAIVD
ncbi:MAG: enoyl-CoA hydratase-related protein, partial [Steroidobacteraceae bacterium]